MIPNHVQRVKDAWKQSTVDTTVKSRQQEFTDALCHKRETVVEDVPVLSRAEQLLRQMQGK